MLQVINQKPAVVSPVYTPSVTGDYDPALYIQNTLVDPLYTPLVPSGQVSIQNDGTDITKDDIVNLVFACCGDTFDPAADKSLQLIFEKVLLHFDSHTNLTSQEVFALQSAKKEGLPPPDDFNYYTPVTDVIPSCADFLAGTCEYDKMFASLAFYARPTTLGFYFANEVAFDDFKTWLNAQVQTISAGLPANTNSLFQDFQTLQLNALTESLTIRTDSVPNDEEYSFARMIVAYLMEYAKLNTVNGVPNSLFGVLPFDLNELYHPNSLVFVNLERHARSKGNREIADEWTRINRSIAMPIKIISNGKLTKLTATMRNVQKAATAAANAQSNSMSDVGRAARTKFRKTPPSNVDIVRLMKRIMDKMAFVATSENTFKATKVTFAKPNRRDPDDFNKQGKITSTKYKPDIHLYIDTSGSISEQNYQDAVKSCIQMARKLNVNLYFNSFSHCMSQCTLLRTKDKSMAQTYKEFEKVPKVTGGTDYEQIWNYINESKKRRRELSVIITDFEWSPPNRYVKHPKNLYYLPCSHMDWKCMVRSADYFVKSMSRIDPLCHKRLLF